MKKSDEFITKSYFDEKFGELNKKFDEKFGELNKKFDHLFQKIDWFAGKYMKFDEEQNLQSKKVSELEERVEIVEKAAGIAN